jgi:ribulose 1,5-bisphosphate synthetase/thiazole synthase
MPHALTSRDSTMESKPVGSYESTGIDVLIVGTGLAGLVAALECTRKGHNVRVLERNATINTAGESHVFQVLRVMLIRKQVICTSWA